MKPNPILEEAWRVKDELAREANDDLHRLCENTRTPAPSCTARKNSASSWLRGNASPRQTPLCS